MTHFFTFLSIIFVKTLGEFMSITIYELFRNTFFFFFFLFFFDVQVMEIKNVGTSE